jgi:hypothetical protein
MILESKAEEQSKVFSDIMILINYHDIMMQPEQQQVEIKTEASN